MRKFLLFQITLCFCFNFLNAQSILCNNWLSTPSYSSAVNIGDLDVSGNQLTIEAVIYQTIPNVAYDGDIVAKHTSPLNDNYLLRPNYCSITTSNGFFQTPDICPLKSNQNYHVAMVYDGSTLKFFRDGFLMSQVNASGSLFQNNIDARIGYYALQDYNSQFLGLINEVRIWNTVRTQTQIRNFMFSSLPTPAIQSGLLAYYVFDNLLNKQGNTMYDGILNGSAAINATVPNCSFLADSCQIDAAIACNSWLSTPSIPSAINIGDLDISGNQLTIEALINQTTPNVDFDGDIVAKHTSPLNDNYLLRPSYCSITTSNGFFQTPPICNVLSNQNYHVAMVYDGTTLKFYRNGFLMSQVNASGNLFQNNYDARIGYYAFQDYNSQFLGFINEVKIWNTSRTQSQIRATMFSTLTSPTTQTGLLAYYTFDNLLNKQGNTNYNGIINGAAMINQTNPGCIFIKDSCFTLLPVKLSQFNTSIAGIKNINLTWKAETEDGIKSYLIERSISASSGFAIIGTINSKQSSQYSTYSFNDTSVRQNVTYFYRVIMLDNAGKKNFSITKSARLNSNNNYPIIVYPSPTSGIIKLDLNQLTGNFNIKVVNTLGQIVLAKPVQVNNPTPVSIDLSNQKSGMYWINIQKDNLNTTRKIIKL